MEENWQELVFHSWTDLGKVSPASNTWVKTALCPAAASAAVLRELSGKNGILGTPGSPHSSGRRRFEQ